MRQEEWFKFCFDTKNNRALPLNLACPEHLSVQSLVSLPLNLACLERLSVQSLVSLPY
jgi:hypothetical protein